MIKLPTDLKWTQPNNSDKFGSLWLTKNINLDEEGYIKLSPRAVKLTDSIISSNAGFPLAIGRHGEGAYQIATSSDANWNLTVGVKQNTWTENSGANEPTLTINSHAVWFKGKWHATTATGVFHRPATGGGSQAWTSAGISLTTGKRHFMAVFQGLQSLCITNGNTVVQYTESGGVYSAIATLTIPSDFEITGLAYNNDKMAVITRLSNDATSGQDQNSYLFIWDGNTTGAGQGLDVDSDSIMGITAYKSSFVILTRTGELLYFNGGGFETLTRLPFYFLDLRWGNPFDISAFGAVPMIADGDVIYLNIGAATNQFGRKAETYLQNFPSGVWCYDPKVGVYHRWSPSISQAYVNFVDGVDINTTTDVLTASAGVFGLKTIPATGNIARLVSTVGIGGLTLNSDYYIIKVSSTTFKLATTKANALAGTAIDITSATTGGNGNYFWLYDLVDYGNTAHDEAGALALTGDHTSVYRDLIFGGRYDATTLTTLDSICITVPFLENRGYFVTSKIFSSQVTDNNQKVFVKFRPLKTDDKIIVKYRERDYLGLPITSSGNSANWTSPSEFYTTQDLSEAKTYLDAGGELECEFLSGAGGGVMVKVSSIGASDGTNTSVVLAEEVLGASSALKAEFIIHNWEVKRTITSSDTSPVEIPIGGLSSWVQFKVELRGSDTTVEEFNFINATAKQSQ